MQKYTKVFFFFSFLTFFLLSMKLFFDLEEMKKLKKLVVKDEAKSLSALFMAVRNTYQNAFIQNHIEINKKTTNLLPVRTADTISKEFSSLIGNRVIIRTVSDTPRNANNKANDLEMNIIDYFNKNPKETSYFKAEKEGIFYYAQALYIKKSCLNCHGKRTEVIKTIREQYDTGYDYKIGDLRGIMSLRINKKSLVDNIHFNFYIDLSTSILVYLLFLTSMYLMIRIIIKNEKSYSLNLEKKVDKQIKEIREKDNTLLHQSKMAEMGEMIGNIAHQWRQPLSTISTVASGIKFQNEFSNLEKVAINDSMDSIVKHTQYLSQTIDDFRNFLKGDKEIIEFSLIDNIDRTLIIVKGTLKKNDINIDINIDEDIKISSYPNELMQVLINIINNAKDAFNERNIKTKRHILIDTKIENDFITIRIKDNALGISEDIINRIFEPYFTTKHQSMGTGLGLYMTRRIVYESLKGSISVKNVEYKIKNENFKGACFEIKLPDKL